MPVGEQVGRSNYYEQSETESNRLEIVYLRMVKLKRILNLPAPKMKRRNEVIVKMYEAKR